MHSYTIDLSTKPPKELTKDVQALLLSLKAVDPTLVPCLIYPTSLARANGSTTDQISASEYFAKTYMSKMTMLPLPTPSPKNVWKQAEPLTESDIAPHLEKITEHASHPKTIFFIVYEKEALLHFEKTDDPVHKIMVQALEKTITGLVLVPSAEETTQKDERLVQEVETEYRRLRDSHWVQRVRTNRLEAEEYQNLPNTLAKKAYLIRHALQHPNSRTAQALEAQVLNHATKNLSSSAARLLRTLKLIGVKASKPPVAAEPAAENAAP